MTSRRHCAAALATAIALGSLGMPAANGAEVAAVLDYAEPLTLSTPASGIVTRVDVNAGQTVKRGQILVRLDDRAQRARVGGLEAQARKFALARDEARREYERARALHEKTVISDHDLRLAEIAAATADADYAEARSQLTAARIALEHASVRSPIDGRVLRVAVAAGETVQNALRATPMVIVADPRQWVARTRLSPAQVAGLRPGQALAVRVGDARYEGRLAVPVPSPDAGTGSEVMVRFAPNPSAPLQPGGAARIDLPGDARHE
ncbi:efflux RND transporter periplasmic adaptor subunit [Acidihalobacter prosperus]|uniref:Multidrug resistance protein MdtA-like barrel-sandwich hybrid domain-containing protein n=1 Tax=Acidihalobacter prosperus TaxID=160660 RepID=A0A1A6C512_9GAMM|nr:efflux RND transporter periplasmic adaptor subunit [Acidihalobacter prosperus]OBS09639.1 hypothetical protein Thpro_021967 [Acidihalobacter prosperus]